MSKAEAQKRVLAMLGAAAFIAEQMGTLLDARIEDDDSGLELNSAVEKPTNRQVKDGINPTLEIDASSL